MRGKQQRPKKEPLSDKPSSATCEACGVSAPANSDGNPMQHFDGRVEKAWESKTYCDGKQH